MLGVGGVRDSAGRPGTGAVCPRRDVLPQLNPALKLTGHSIGSGAGGGCTAVAHSLPRPILRHEVASFTARRKLKKM